MEVYVDDEAKLTLHGLQQHYVKLKENEKNKKLYEIKRENEDARAREREKKSNKTTEREKRARE